MTQVTKDKLEIAKRFHAEGLSIDEACRKAHLPKATYAYHVYGPYNKGAKTMAPKRKKAFAGTRRKLRGNTAPVGVRGGRIQGIEGFEGFVGANIVGTTQVALILGTPVDVGRVLNAAWSSARM